jgi:hypothetical protein
MSKKTKAKKPEVDPEEEALLRYWEKHSTSRLTHYLAFEDFKAGWRAAYAFNAE